MTLYHGNHYIKSLESIVKNGFDTSKVGSGWGMTYGAGVYFSDNLEIAHEVYSNNNGYVVAVEIDTRAYQLTKDYTVSNKKQIKQIIVKNINTKKYNMLITKGIEPEYVLFDLDAIVSVKLLKIDNCKKLT